MVMTARMTIMLSTSPMQAEMTAARMRINTRKIRKLPQKDLQNTLLLAGVQFIGSVFCQTIRRILLR